MNKKYIIVMLISWATTNVYTHEPTINVSEGTLENLGSIVLGNIPVDDRFDTAPTFHEREPIPLDMPVNDSSRIIATTCVQESMRQLFPSPPPVLSFQALDDSLTTIPPDTM